jgi:hypothetical protein
MKQGTRVGMLGPRDVRHRIDARKESSSRGACGGG